MSFAAPWALIGLASLPILWWLHIRRKRPVVVDSPSLMFVLDEDQHIRLPRGRRIDWELVLTLAAAALLTLAAAGPRWQSERAFRVVRVVVVGGAQATAPGREAAFEDAVADIRNTLASGDQLRVVWIPERDVHGDWRLAPRPSLDRILGTARAGEATVRYVVDDRLPEEPPADIGWIARGSPSGSNRGILSARVLRDEKGPRLFLVVQPAEGIASFRISNGTASVTRDASGVGMGRVGTAEIPFDDAARVTVTLEVGSKPGENLIPTDDEVVLTRARVRAHIAPSLPKDVRETLHAALHAASNSAVEHVARTEAQVVFGTQGRGQPDQWFVGLTFAPTDAPPVALPGGDDIVSSAPLAHDLTLEGVAWRFAVAPEPVDPSTVLLGRVAGGSTWPVLVQEARSTVRLLALPPPKDAPFWPLLVENVLDTMGGADAGGGYRIRGVLDPAVTRFGRDVQAFDPAALRAVPPDRNPKHAALRPWCLALALLAVGLLWFLPAFRHSQKAWAPAYAE